MDTFHFNELNVLVTGSSRGLGLALVQEFSKRGTKRIYAGCRTEEGCKYLSSLRLPGVSPILLDVTNASHISHIPEAIDKLDVLVNNAGIASLSGYTTPAALEVAASEMNVHYFGALAVLQKVLPLLERSSRSGIINISSIAGLSNFKAMGTYSASKAAFHFFTQGLRAELASKGIFVQGVYPGPFDTRLAASFTGPKPSPEHIATVILDAFQEKTTEVFPDEFSKSMHAIFLDSPKKLDSIFSDTLS